eukprot:scaffold3768_cov376-Prasinococcus_capsulatus_cf.AAC.14
MVAAARFGSNQSWYWEGWHRAPTPQSLRLQSSHQLTNLSHKTRQLGALLLARALRVVFDTSSRATSRGDRMDLVSAVMTTGIALMRLESSAAARRHAL